MTYPQVGAGIVLSTGILLFFNLPGATYLHPALHDHLDFGAHKCLSCIKSVANCGMNVPLKDFWYWTRPFLKCGVSKSAFVFTLSGESRV